MLCEFLSTLVIMEVPFVTMSDCWINYTNKGVYEGIFSMFVKRNIQYSIRLIMELLCAFRVKIRSAREEIDVYGLSWGVYFHCGEKGRQVCVLELIYKL